MADGNQDKPWLEDVDGDARRMLIECNKQYIQVVAGPGSGKTFGLKRRVKRLVQGDGVMQSDIFVGTFTRAIRDELKAELIPTDVMARDEESIAIETLHSQAYGMLLDNPGAHPGREFRFLLGHEEDAMLHDLSNAIPELSFYERRDAMRKVESYWSGASELEDERFRGAMVAWLEQHRAMHVGEVVYIALSAMERGDLPLGIFSNVVVDEYQDLTSAEQKLVEKLCSADGCLMVLGDDDQSIYGFRYNHPGGITEFPNGRDPATIQPITIEENRRCGSVIVDLANSMMAAAGSKKPPMISKRGEVGEVDAMHWRTLDDEIDGLADYMMHDKETRFLVLVTRREIGYRLRDKIGDDAWTSFHEEVLRLDIVRERFALASLMANEDDAVALRAWLSFKASSPEFGPERNTVAVKSLASSGLARLALIEAVANLEVRPKGSGQKAVLIRCQDYLKRKHDVEGMDLDEKIKYLFNPDLAGAIEEGERRRHAKDDLSLLEEAALQIKSRLKEPTLARVVDSLRYRISTRQPLLDVEPNARVRIMTLHGAKGLEADSIVVAGLADQILPGIDVPDARGAQERRDEQRRLLYVAITRAKKHLILSWPQTMTFADAISQNVRKDSVFTAPGGTRMVRLSSCRFLPAGVSAKAGDAWLKAKGAR